MFKRKLEIIFLVVIVISISILVNNYYNNYKFNHNDISKEYQKLITDKEKDVLNMMQKNYGFSFKVPLIITDKFKGRLYGLTSYKPEFDNITPKYRATKWQSFKNYPLNLAKARFFSIFFKISPFIYPIFGCYIVELRL